MRPVNRAAPLLLYLAVVGACALSDQPLERRDLERDVASNLRMSGADELAHVGDERRTTIEGAQRPFEGRIFGTMATAEEVFAFYGRELMALGWQRQQAVGRSTVELDLRSWCKPKIWFRLAIVDRARAFQPAFYRGRDYTTVFDATLIGTDPKSACPGQTPSPTAR